MHIINTRQGITDGQEIISVMIIDNGLCRTGGSGSITVEQPNWLELETPALGTAVKLSKKCKHPTVLPERSVLLRNQRCTRGEATTCLDITIFLPEFQPRLLSGSCFSNCPLTNPNSDV